MRVTWAKSRMLARAILLIVMMMVPAAGEAQTAGAPLVLEVKIPLGEVSGRIDHLAIDVQRQRLFVAGLGNDTLGVVDLAAGKVRAPSRVPSRSGSSASPRLTPLNGNQIKEEIARSS